MGAAAIQAAALLIAERWHDENRKNSAAQTAQRIKKGYYEVI